MKKHHRLTSALIFWLSAALLLLAVGGCGSASSEPSAESAETPVAVTVVDDQQREVTIPDGPADRAVVVGSFNVDLVLALGGREKIVGIDQSTIDRLTASEFSDDLAVGKSGDELNYEAIVAVDPDVVFVYRNHPWEALAEQLAPFDIPVVVLSTWVFTEWENSVALASTVLGLDDGADRLLEFTGRISTLLARTSEVETPAVLSYEDPDGITSGKDGGKNSAINAAGITNLFGETPGNEIEVDPEAVLEANPDVIVAETSNTYGGTTEADFQAKAAELLARPGWSELSAVTDGHTWLYNAWAFDLAGNQITPLFFAAWAYPELFADVDPLDFVEEWATDFIGVTDFDRNSGYIFQVVP